MITVRKLARAIEKRLGSSPEDAREQARLVMGYFGFRETIIDNALDAEDRKMFYALSDAGLLQSTWETVPLLDGRNWRIFYWSLDTGSIEALQADEEAPTEDRTYKGLPDEAWSHAPTAG